MLAFRTKKLPPWVTIIGICLTWGCGGSSAPSIPNPVASVPTPPPGPTVLYRGAVADQRGDTSTGPDLSAASLDVLSDGTIRLHVEFVAGTYLREVTNVRFELDTDQNRTTGTGGFAGLGGASDLGVDWIANMGASFFGARATLQKDNGRGFYATYSTAPVTFGANTMDVTLPISEVDGRMFFRVLSGQSTDFNFGRVLDEMPDNAAGPGVVR